MIRKKYKIHYFNEFFLMLILLNIYESAKNIEVRLGYVRYLLYLHYIYSLYLFLPYLIISHEYNIRESVKLLLGKRGIPVEWFHIKTIGRKFFLMFRRSILLRLSSAVTFHIRCYSSKDKPETRDSVSLADHS